MIRRTREELEAGLGHVRSAPAAQGTLELIARRPTVDARELLDRGTLSELEGLVGDSWSLRTVDGGAPSRDAQVTVMNARAAAVVSGVEEWQAWALAGDQLYVDFDISHANLPAGIRLRVGGAVLEVSSLPHLGCGKFARRFGADAVKFVNSPEGRALRLRGVNTRVVEAGPIATGDPVLKLDTFPFSD